MTDHDQGRSRKRTRIALIGAALIAVLAGLLVPPWININRYKSSVTSLISASLGRPVKLSSVELRLLPWPGFTLTDLTVAEDPAYGAEPVLHANTVTASIRLRSLWRGRMEISRISVDEASLNLVNTAPGDWNLNALIRTATGSAPAAGQSPAQRLPYLEATDSRINVKQGPEKLPYSLLNTDLSFWQEDSGQWRVRLRGQPVRTDLSLETGDTGTIRLEAAMRPAPDFNQTPIHVDLDWSEAQMGQFARLITGSDPGWRGDLTGQLQLDGTPAAAQVETRLRATGVHRAEFAPPELLDFDANCGFLYHASRHALEKLVCDSPLGKGLVHLTGAMAGAGQRDLALELDRVPIAAALGVLRTVRSGLAPDLEAQGTVSGKLAYSSPADRQNPPAPTQSSQPNPRTKKKPAAPAETPLTGVLTVENFGLGGAGLPQLLALPRIVLTPAAPTAAAPLPALTGTVAVPAGSPTPLSITLRLAPDGYQATAHGQASIKWARDVAHATGLTAAAALNNLAGDAITVDLAAQGRWQPNPPDAATGPTDKLNGSVTLRNANWKPDFLANRVEIAQATLHLDNGQLRWDPVAFSYGPVKGTATVTFPAACSQSTCPPRFELQFGDLDASSLEAAFLGAEAPDTLLSTVIARLHPAEAPSWPELTGTVKANSLDLGLNSGLNPSPAQGDATLVKPAIALSIHSDHAEFVAIDAQLLGGRVEAEGSLTWPATAAAKPSYSLNARFHGLSPQSIGHLVGENWSGGPFNAEGKLDLSGFTGADLAASAKGTLHFDWRHGAIAAAAETEAVTTPAIHASAHWSAKLPLPPELARFDDWTADAAISNGTIVLGTNQVVTGPHKQPIQATVTLGEPPTVKFIPPADASATKR